MTLRPDGLTKLLRQQEDKCPLLCLPPLPAQGNSNYHLAFVYSFNKHLVSTNHISNLMLGARDPRSTASLSAISKLIAQWLSKDKKIGWQLLPHLPSQQLPSQVRCEDTFDSSLFPNSTSERFPSICSLLLTCSAISQVIVTSCLDSATPTHPLLSSAPLLPPPLQGDLLKIEIRSCYSLRMMPQ